MSLTIKNIILLLLTATGIVSIFFFDRIPQDLAYHHFADDRMLFSIPNYWNVISNLPFLLIGIIGVYILTKKKLSVVDSMLSVNYLMFFSGVFLTGAGSSYYHLHPNNDTLLWDRLPMTISFMSFFTIIIGEYVNIKAGKTLLFPLLITGVISVMYWYVTETLERGDLRMYVLVQFLPLLLIPFILLLFRSPFNGGLYIWLMILAYALSKTFESYDASVFNVGGVISGHSIKHFMAALAPVILLVGLFKRSKIKDPV